LVGVHRRYLRNFDDGSLLFSSSFYSAGQHRLPSVFDFLVSKKLFAYGFHCFIFSPPHCLSSLAACKGPHILLRACKEHGGFPYFRPPCAALVLAKYDQGRPLCRPLFPSYPIVFFPHVFGPRIHSRLNPFFISSLFSHPSLLCYPPSP